MNDNFVNRDQTDLSTSRDQTGPGELPTICPFSTTGTSFVPASGVPTAPPACPTYAGLLVDLSDGELPLDQQHVVREHVAACPGCRAELARLDTSLARLADGIANARVMTAPPRSRASHRRLALAVAATSLICLFGVCWSAWHWTPRPVATLPAVKPQPLPLVSPADALRQIALIEQYARLQTSLDLLPDDPAYAAERAANERLLVKFQEAATDAAPRTDKGETL
jgi:Putative zinc-finger